MSFKSVCIVGGAGFIGSHFTDRLLSDARVERVTLYDNFSSGREWHFAAHKQDPRLRVVRGEVRDESLLTETVRGHDCVIHLASNPDIAKAMTDPAIDFHEGTALTHHVIEAVRLAGVPCLLYASGSGVYGDRGTDEAQEDDGPMIPASTYGASKLAGEAMIASYCAMFDLRARAFRFGNVVGARQTHGVAFDFIKRLLKNPRELRILGDGTQSKSYIHVSDVVSAVLMAGNQAMDDSSQPPFQVFNVATGDYITVREIAELCFECLDLNPASVEMQFGTSNRGWKGDVPVVRLNTDRIQSIGWKCGMNTRAALKKSILDMLPDAREGRL